MSFVLAVPSLVQLSCMKHSISLWQSNPLQGLDPLKARVIQGKILQQVDTLDIPKTIKEELRNTFVGLVEMEMYAWLNNVNIDFGLDERTFEIFWERTKWNAYGKIDENASILAVLNSEDLSLKEKFEIASMFCITDSVYEIWQQLSVDIKEEFKKVRETTVSWKNISVNFWVDIVERHVNVSDDWEKLRRMISNSIAFRNLSATDYLLTLVTTKPRKEKILLTGISVLNSRISASYFLRDGNYVYYFLTRIEENHLDQLFNSSQSRFPTAYTLLSDITYFQLLEPIFHRIRHSLLPSEFQKILHQMANCAYTLKSDRYKDGFTFLWNNAAVECKTFVLANPMGQSNCCFWLCKAKDMRNMVMLLREMSFTQRSKLISTCLDYCDYYVDWPDSQFFDGCLKELLLCTVGTSGAGTFDPNEDQDLALALRLSIEEERQRQEEEARRATVRSIAESNVPAAEAQPETEESLLEKAIAMSMEQDVSSDDLDYVSMTEEEAIAYAVRMSLEEMEGTEDVPIETGEANEESDDDDYSDVMNDPAFLISVLESLPGVDPQSEVVRNAVEMLTQQREKEKKKDKKGEKEKEEDKK